MLHVALGIAVAWAVASPAWGGEDPLADPPADSTSQSDREEPVPVNPYFQLEDLPAAPAESPLEVHGRFDVTVGFFESRSNVDGFDRDFIDVLNPAIYLSYSLVPRLRAVVEIEYEGQDGEIDVDQMLLELDVPEIGGSVDFGVNYVPFGVERFYYSSTTNPLVDRPSPFRRIFPGSYSDFGVFVDAAHEFEEDGFRIRAEAALTRALHGPDRDDRPDSVVDGTDEPQGTARLGFRLVPGLEVGVSALRGSFDEREGKGRLALLGGDVVIGDALRRVRVEYLEGPVEQSAAAGGDFRRKGWYVEGYHRFPFDRPWLRAIEAVVRFDWLDENSEVRDFRDVRRTAVGLNWVPQEHMRLKLEYLFADERFEEIRNDGFLAQFEVHF